MKVVHTADWHIGKMLHRQDLAEEITLFFDWLIDFIVSEHIDLLLVSGDIFDLANPSHKDLALYYETLLRLSRLNIQIIITGGNHDSISLLEGPAGLLRTHNIQVVSGAKENLADEIILCRNADGSPGCIVLAVPFLRDKDIRMAQSADIQQDRLKDTESGIRSHYAQLIEICKKQYDRNIPVIAMGHMMLKGAITSDSEREIHIGNLDGLAYDVVPEKIDYMALGHIHKPQKVHNLEHVRYSGSPIFLDFSERNYSKYIILVDISDKESIRIIPQKIPTFRALIRFSGDVATVRNNLKNFKNTCPLTAFIELDIKETMHDVLKYQEFEMMKENNNSDQYKIILPKFSIVTDDGNHNVISGIDPNTSINELSPIDIFRQRLGETNLDKDITEALMNAYMLLIEEANH